VASACEEPTERLSELQAIFEREANKSIIPIVAKYCRALKYEQDRATKDGDLDSALAYRNEREKIESEYSNALSSEAGEPEPRQIARKGTGSALEDLTADFLAKADPTRDALAYLEGKRFKTNAGVIDFTKDQALGLRCAGIGLHVGLNSNGGTIRLA